MLENAFSFEDKDDILARLKEAIHNLPQDSTPARTQKETYAKAYNELIRELLSHSSFHPICMYH